MSKIQQRHLQLASFAATACVFLQILSPQSAIARPGSIYTVSGVTVDAVAKNAVLAKTKAVKAGQVEALRRLLKRLTKYTDYQRLPQITLAAAEDSLDNIGFLKERNSRTRYIAKLSYSFRPRLITSLLQGQGVSFTDRQAPELVLIPSFSAAASPVSPALDNSPAIKNNVEQATVRGWHKALAGLDLTHAIAPVRLGQPSAPAGYHAQDTQTGNSDRDSMKMQIKALRQRYQTSRLVLATVAAPPGSSHLTVVLAGQDAVGGFSVSQRIRIFDGDVKTAMDEAAAVSLKVLEGRWKSARLGLGDEKSSGQNAQAALLRDKIAMTVRFSGLRQWQQIRKKLANLSGAYDMQVGALSPRGASVALSFPGGAPNLARELSRLGLSMQNTGNGWTVSAR